MSRFATTREAVAHAVAAVEAQGERCVDGDDTCVYSNSLGSLGSRCVVGHMLPDEAFESSCVIYNHSVSRFRTTDLVDWIAPDVGEHLGVLDDLQSVHDYWIEGSFVERVKAEAKRPLLDLLGYSR